VKVCRRWDKRRADGEQNSKLLESLPPYIIHRKWLHQSPTDRQTYTQWSISTYALPLHFHFVSFFNGAGSHMILLMLEFKLIEFAERNPTELVSKLLCS